MLMVADLQCPLLATEYEGRILSYWRVFILHVSFGLCWLRAWLLPGLGLHAHKLHFCSPVELDFHCPDDFLLCPSHPHMQPDPSSHLFPVKTLFPYLHPVLTM